MAIPVQNKRMSAVEYLAFEERSRDRHEFHNGEVLAMSGGTYKHSRIIANLIREIGNGLKGSNCFVLEGNMRVRIPRPPVYVYPDACIVCGKPIFDPDDPKQATILNPRIVIEVLSESTEAYDRGSKFSLYREISALETYVLVSQDRPSVETFTRRENGEWAFLPFHGLDKVASLPAVKTQLPLSEVFGGIEFPDAPPVIDATAQ